MRRQEYRVHSYGNKEREIVSPVLVKNMHDVNYGVNYHQRTKRNSKSWSFELQNELFFVVVPKKKTKIN